MKNKRICNHCGGVISLTMRSDAKFCSVACRDRFHIEQRKKKVIRAKMPDPGQGVSMVSDQSDILLAKIEGQLNRIIKLIRTQTGLKERYLNPNQVMKELSINRTTFERWVKDGILKTYNITDRKIYCKKSDIDQLFKDL